MSNVEEWVKPIHLAPDLLACYQRSFLESTAGLLVIDDFLQAWLAEDLRSFLASKAEYLPQFGLYSAGTVDETLWLSAAPADRMYKFDRIAKAKSGCELDRATITFAKLRSAIRQQVFTEFFETIVQQPLGGTTVLHAQRFLDGHFIRLHTDNALERRLAVILYLVNDKPPFGGGRLNISVRGKLVRTVDAAFNRLVFFDVAKNEHWVEPLQRSSPENARWSIGWWFRSGQKVPDQRR